jgi:hypothetical protein
MDGAPWSVWADQPLGPRRLARELARYGVRPVTFDAKTGKAKGYVTFPTTGKQTQLGLGDAWTRYLSEPENPGTAGNSQDQPVTEVSPVTELAPYMTGAPVTESDRATDRDNHWTRPVTDVPSQSPRRTT